MRLALCIAVLAIVAPGCISSSRRQPPRIPTIQEPSDPQPYYMGPRTFAEKKR